MPGLYLVCEYLKERKPFTLAAALSEEIEEIISARIVRTKLAEAGLKGCNERNKPC